MCFCCVGSFTVWKYAKVQNIWFHNKSYVKGHTRLTLVVCQKTWLQCHTGQREDQSDCSAAFRKGSNPIQEYQRSTSAILTIPQGKWGFIFSMAIEIMSGHIQLRQSACDDITVERCQGWICQSKMFYPRCLIRENIIVNVIWWKIYDLMQLTARYGAVNTLATNSSISFFLTNMKLLCRHHYCVRKYTIVIPVFS